MASQGGAKDIPTSLKLTDMMMPMSEPKVIDGFQVDMFRVKVEGLDDSPAQNIANLHHLKSGADCYVATEADVTMSDAEMAEEAKIIYSRLAAESRRFAQLDSGKNESDPGQLVVIHRCAAKYASAPDAGSLAGIRQEFKQLAQEFDIPESLSQIDLAATWEWQIKHDLKKPIGAPLVYKPIDGFNPDDFKVGPILMQPDNEKNKYH